MIKKVTRGCGMSVIMGHGKDIRLSLPPIQSGKTPQTDKKNSIFYRGVSEFGCVILMTVINTCRMIGMTTN